MIFEGFGFLGVSGGTLKCKSAIPFPNGFAFLRYRTKTKFSVIDSIKLEPQQIVSGSSLQIYLRYFTQVAPCLKNQTYDTTDKLVTYIKDSRNFICFRYSSKYPCGFSHRLAGAIRPDQTPFSTIRRYLQESVLFVKTSAHVSSLTRVNRELEHVIGF